MKVGKIISPILGVALGIPIALYGANHRSKAIIDAPLTDWEENQIMTSETEPLKVEKVALNLPESVTLETLEVATTTAEAETTTEYVCQWEAYNNIPISKDMQKEIKSVCDKHELSFDLMLAIAYTESRLNINAIGDQGEAIGLMQIQPKWWQNLADIYGLDIYDPVDNVELSCVILTILLDQYEGDLTKALQAYNTGDGYSNNGYAQEVYNNMELVLTLPTDQSECVNTNIERLNK